MTDDGVMPGSAVPHPRGDADGRGELAPALPLARRPEPAGRRGGAVATVAPPWLRIPAVATADVDDAPVVSLVARDGRRVGRRARRAATLDPAPARPVPADPVPARPTPAVPVPSGSVPAAPRDPAAPVVYRPAVQRARPPVEPEPSILGLSRLARGRVGSRLFTLFFVFVYALIAVQLLVALLHG